MADHGEHHPALRGWYTRALWMPSSELKGDRHGAHLGMIEELV